MEKNLDKLNLQSKWIVIPRLISGYVLDTGGQAYDSLVKLVRSRNRIVHHKSRNAVSMPLSRLWEISNEMVEEQAEEAILALDLLLSEAKKFDTPEVAEVLLGRD